MDAFSHKKAAGFTLVEIVIAIGIFTFALIGIVLLLGNALRSSTETQRDSALATALMTSSSLLRSLGTNVSATNLYFNQQGSLLASTTQSFYLFSLQSVGSGSGPTNQELWKVKVTAPYPATNSVGDFVLSRVKS